MNKTTDVYDPSQEREIKALEKLVTPIAERVAIAHAETLRSQERQRESDQKHRLDVMRLTFEHQNKVLARVFPFFWAVLVVIAVAIGVAFYIKRADLAYNVIALVIGWLGGYGYGRRKPEGSLPP